MIISYNMAYIDNGGRRTGSDRRQFSYAGHIPERRSGEDRRNCNKDRRIATDRRNGEDRRQQLDAKIINLSEWKNRRSGEERRQNGDRRKVFQN